MRKEKQKLAPISRTRMMLTGVGCLISLPFMLWGFFNLVVVALVTGNLYFFGSELGGVAPRSKPEMLGAFIVLVLAFFIFVRVSYRYLRWAWQMQQRYNAQKNVPQGTIDDLL